MNKAKWTVLVIGVLAIAGCKERDEFATNSEGPTVEKAAGVLIATIRDVDFAQMYGWQGDQYKLPLIARLPNPVLGISGGMLEKAVTDTGKSLLPQMEMFDETTAAMNKNVFLEMEEQNRKIRFAKLKEDNRTIEFNITIRAPDTQKQLIREISGTLEYYTAKGTREVDLGVMDFRIGAKGKELETFISSIEPAHRRKNYTAMGLRINLSPETVNSATFYTQEGSKLDVLKSGTGIQGDETTIYFSIKGKFPPKGRIVLQVLNNFKRYKISFKAANILLDGNSFYQKDRQ